MTTIHIWCDVCESKKGPLFKINNDNGEKRYICKKCLMKLKMMKTREEIVLNAERKREVPKCD